MINRDINQCFENLLKMEMNIDTHIIHRKNDFAKRSKIFVNTDLKIILLES